MSKIFVRPYCAREMKGISKNPECYEMCKV
jgi:hypothetical protein